MNDKKQIFGWAMYDWANSAFATTILVGVFPLYFGSVIVPEGGALIGGDKYSATALLGFMSSFYALLLFLCAPVLGAIADFSLAKKRFLMVFCYVGSLFSILLGLCGPGDVWLAMIIFVIAQIGFVGGNIFYDAFLPQIASEDQIDWVSGKGFAYGYIGGGIQLALAFGLIAAHDMLGISEMLAARFAMATTGLWWGGFSIITFVYLKESGTSKAATIILNVPESGLDYIRIGLRRTITTARKVKRFKHLLLFLFAFMIYNDAIQTVIKMASIYGQQELKIPTTFIMMTLLIIQFVAFGGALIFGWLAQRISAKRALLVSLVLWSGVVIYGYYMSSPGEFLVLGGIVGIAMGGSQALSRSLYGAMIPAQASAEFYGFYSVFTKFSAIWGTALFGIIEHFTGSARNAILSLVLFFIVGIVLLSMVDVESAKKAKRQSLFV